MIDKEDIAEIRARHLLVEKSYRIFPDTNRSRVLIEAHSDRGRLLLLLSDAIKDQHND